MIYLPKLEDAVHVLHCFQKKNPKTATSDIGLARNRYSQWGGDVAITAKPEHAASLIPVVEICRKGGGPQQSRKSLPISLEKYNDSRPGRYGEAVGLRIAGIRQGNVVFSTRFHTWSIKNKVGDRNCTQAVPAVGQICEKGAAIIGLPPWSSVNNCTESLASRLQSTKVVM